MAETIDFTVSHRGQAYQLSLVSQSTLSALKRELEDITSIPPEFQKLLYRGKRPVEDEDVATLAEAGLKSGVKVTLMGSTSEAISDMKKAEAETRRREDILRRRQARGPSKVSSTSKASVEDLQYRFHQIEPLSHLPNPSAARDLLERLAVDPAIRHVMKKHQFAVGLLTELAPHEHPNLLGLNENGGQVIKLRLRTNTYDGMRFYKDIRMVLCHELTHNVWSEHDDNFKSLNSTLNREVEEYERSARNGSHSLSGLSAGDYYEPEVSSTLTEAESHSRVLGGGSGTSSTLVASREEMRTRALEAALERQRKREKEIEDQCGSDGQAALR